MRDALRPNAPPGEPGKPGKHGKHDLPTGTPGRVIVRPRLVELLDEAVRDSVLTLVCAPAGSGKTAAVSTWAALRRMRGPLVWVTTDAREMGRRAFWQRVARGVEDSSQRSDVLRVPVDRKHLAAATRRLARLGGPVVLVVDEGARPADPTLHRELDRYVREAGEGIRLVVVTRADPVLPLHRYRLAHALAEIRVEDLRFTQSEARELVARSGVQVTRTQVATLLEKTGGWAAGLEFATSFLQGQRDTERAVGAFTGSDRAVSDFLVKEFLDAQPSNVREVLLRSSVVDELPVGLFEALTGAPDGQAVLGFLNRANTFLSPAPGSAHSYQYPPLLREFLRTRLAFEHPRLVVELHQVAAQWWFRNGSVHEAIHHSVEAGRWDDAARYVIDGLAVGEILNDRVDTLAGPLEGIPSRIDTAPATVVRAALALRHGAPEVARQLLTPMRSSLAEGTGEPTGPAHAGHDESLLFCIQLLEAGIAVHEHETDGGLEAVRRAERHLHKLHPSRDTLPELWGLLATYRSWLQLWRGEVHAVRLSLREVADAARMAHETGWEVFAHAQGAVLAAIVGDLEEALGLAESADEQAQEQIGPRGEDRARSALAKAWVLTERSLIGRAREELARADEVATETEATSRGLLAIVRSRLLHAQGYYSAARAALLDAGSQDVGALPPWLEAWVGLARQVHAASEGSSASAAAEGRAVRDLEGWQGTSPLEVRVTRALLDADFCLSVDDEHGAINALLESLQLAAPQQLRRPFTEAPSTVRHLLRGVEDLRSRHPWLTDGGTTGRAGAAAPLSIVPRQRVPEEGRQRQGTSISALPDVSMHGTVLVEELTAKELEVLGHLAELHTTDEIGAEMFISVNTVRTHVRNVLRKLQVDRRNQAVRRAWELRLLSGPPGRSPRS